MTRDYETIRVEDQGGGLTIVTLSRPDVANAMNTQMGRDLLAFSTASTPTRWRIVALC